MIGDWTLQSLAGGAYTINPNTKNSYILPTKYLYVLYVSQKKNSDFFPYTAVADWFL